MSANGRPTSPTEQLRAAILAELEKWEREHRAEVLAAGGDSTEDGYGDPLSRRYLRWLAHQFTQHRDQPDNLRGLLDGLAEDATLDDVRTLRLAGEAAVAATPRVIKDASKRGMKPPQIAAEIGLTERRVQQILREQRAQ